MYQSVLICHKSLYFFPYFIKNSTATYKLFFRLIVKTMARVPFGFPNTGNTCYISSTIQCLSAVRSFREQCRGDSELERVVLGKFARPAELLQGIGAAYQWCRQLMNIKRASPEDPAELLLKLFDNDLNPDMNTCCFENTRTKRKRCTQCNHVTETNSKEKMLIVTCLPAKGASPVQRAVDACFGFERQSVPAAPATRAAPAVPLPVADTNAPPMSFHNYNRGFAGPSLPVPKTTPVCEDEIWYRCDDESVTPVRLSTCQPYLLFFEERQTAAAATSGAEESPPAQLQTLSLDCDDGACKSKQAHETYVCSYDLSTALVIHIAVPQHRNMALVERTLMVGCEGGKRAYDLVSFIARVGTNHYVAYVKKK